MEYLLWGLFFFFKFGPVENRNDPLMRWDHETPFSIFFYYPAFERKNEKCWRKLHPEPKGEKGGLWACPQSYEMCCPCQRDWIFKPRVLKSSDLSTSPSNQMSAATLLQEPSRFMPTAALSLSSPIAQDSYSVSCRDHVCQTGASVPLPTSN